MFVSSVLYLNADSDVYPAGFTKRDESEYDPFGAGHSSTSISAALGMAVARDFKVQAALPSQDLTLMVLPTGSSPSVNDVVTQSHVLLQGRKNHCVAVIGDGAITGGMAYEAMNHAGFLDKNMIVVLNDNQQVCTPCQRLFPCLAVSAASTHLVLYGASSCPPAGARP